MKSLIKKYDLLLPARNQGARWRELEAELSPPGQASLAIKRKILRKLTRRIRQGLLCKGI
jgi:hypothetical protein